VTNQAAITQVTIAYTEKTENYKQAAKHLSVVALNL